MKWHVDRRQFLRCSAALAVTLGHRAGAEAQKVAKVVLLAGKKSHRPGQHEYEKAVRLFKHCLDNSPNVEGVVCEVHTNGWPKDPTTLEDADTIVLFSDGNGRAQHPFMVGDRMKVVERQMDRGCGLVLIHWSLCLPSELGRRTFLRWIGGFEDYQNPPRPRGAPVLVEGWSKQRQHPICRGLKPFKMPKDEYYWGGRYLSGEPGFVPILPYPGDRNTPLWAWAYERPGGGRGFGFTGGHSHSCWSIDPLRKAMLNAILWTAGKGVPSEGVISTVPEHLK